MERKYKVVLTIAGSDSSGGAGIQADIKAISALDAYAASVITAITAQNTEGVYGIHPVPADMVSAQLEAVFTDLSPDSVKIGMVNTPEEAQAIASTLEKYRPRHVVFDPVMVSTSGCGLMADGAMKSIVETLFPLSGLVTPNLQECGALTGKQVSGLGEMEQAARTLCSRYGCSVLVKGGHSEGDEMTDVLYNNGRAVLFHGKRIDTPNTHGTGCTLSSAIATFLAKGFSMEDSVQYAKDYVTLSIAAGKELGIGHGHGPLWHQAKGTGLRDAQQRVDRWIRQYGVRYFNELTNMAVLTEEVGELARVMARKYGEQSFKPGENQDPSEEMADILWVLACLANQTGTDLSEALERSFAKKTARDSERHRNNPKINDFRND